MNSNLPISNNTLDLASRSFPGLDLMRIFAAAAIVYLHSYGQIRWMSI